MTASPSGSLARSKLRRSHGCSQAFSHVYCSPCNQELSTALTVPVPQSDTTSSQHNILGAATPHSTIQSLHFAHALGVKVNATSAVRVPTLHSVA